MQEYKDLYEKLTDKMWRMDNLYHIVNKAGNLVPFRMNKHQRKFMEERHGFDIILKARQLGFSTLKAIDQLDQAMFNNNYSSGIIDSTEADAKEKLKKIKIAYKAMPVEFIESGKDDNIGARTIVKSNETSIELSNGSEIRVGTSHRGATLQSLHISEHAKICRDFPIRSREIKTGALNAVDKGGSILIESTARGADGDFFDMCRQAQKNEELSDLDFKFHFFPWFDEDGYRLEVPTDFRFSVKFKTYFDNLAAHNIILDDEQKYWYIKKYETLGETMKEEYPSTPEEAFESSDDDKYYGTQMTLVRKESRITHVPYEEGLPVVTFWDLGMRDYTAVWFFQQINRELHFIDYYQNSGEGLAHYVDVLNDKTYSYGKHIAPHDIAVRELGTGVSRLETASKLGIEFEIAPNLSLNDGIQAVRSVLSKCWFDRANCADGIECLEKYAKQWNEARGMYIGEKQGKYNHGADAFRMFAVSMNNMQEPETSYEEAERSYTRKMDDTPETY